MLHIQQQCKYFIPILLVFLAIVRVPAPDNQLRYLFQLMAEMAVILGLAVFIYQNVNKWIGLFVILALFSSICPVFDKASYMARNAIVFHCIWIAVVALSVRKVGVLFNAICIIALANSVFAIMQSLGVDPYKVFSFGVIQMTCSGGLYSGLMSNPNELSALLAICFPAFLRRYWVLLLPIILNGLVVANSTGGVIALCVGMSFYCFARSRNMRLIHVFG